MLTTLVDWLLNPKKERYDPYSAVDFERDDLASYTTVDAAPILKLNSAILNQAVSERAERIDLRRDLDYSDWIAVETREAYEDRIELENLRVKLKGSRSEYARMMAEAGIVSDVHGQSDQNRAMVVVYTFSKMPLLAMSIPANLVEPSMRAYRYFFNYQNAASMARAENALKVECKGTTAIASVDRYAPSSEHMLGVALEYC